MNDQERAIEFRHFVGAMPKRHEMGLYEDNVATAYHKARQAGWPADDLVADAKQILLRGAGIGLVVNRLKTLAVRGPMDRSGIVVIGPWQPGPFIPEQWEPIPAEWVEERMGVLKTVGGGGFTPDEAEALMTETIQRQKYTGEIPTGESW